MSDVALLNPLQCLDFILIILRMSHVEEMKGKHLVFSESGPLYCDVILRMSHVEEMKGVHLVFSESGPLYCDVDKHSLRRK